MRIEDFEILQKYLPIADEFLKKMDPIYKLPSAIEFVTRYAPIFKVIQGTALQLSARGSAFSAIIDNDIFIEKALCDLVSDRYRMVCVRCGSESHGYMHVDRAALFIEEVLNLRKPA